MRERTEEVDITPRLAATFDLQEGKTLLAFVRAGEEKQLLCVTRPDPAALQVAAASSAPGAELLTPLSLDYRRRSLMSRRPSAEGCSGGGGGGVSSSWTERKVPNQSRRPEMVDEVELSFRRLFFPPTVINLPVDRTGTKSPNRSSDPVAGR